LVAFRRCDRSRAGKFIRNISMGESIASPKGRSFLAL
jgi:hypothetical protein